MRPSNLIVMACLLSCCVAAGAQEKAKPSGDDEPQRYQIQLSRPSKVGEQFHIEATGATKSTAILQVDGQERDPIVEVYGITIEGVVKILEVTKSGAETKLSLKIETCIAAVGEKKLPLLPAGTEVVASWNKEKRRTVYSLDGKDLPDQVSEMLALVVNTSDPESLSDDEIFGTKEKRQVGDAWPVDAEAAVKELKRIGLTTKSDDIYGEVTLAEQKKVKDTPSLVIKTDFKARSIASDGKQDQQMKVLSGNLTIETTVALPVDPKLPPSSSSMTMKLTRVLSGAGADGQEVRAVETSERMVERTIRPVAP